MVALYVAACLTTGSGPHHLRPLFEGVGPSSPYRWVRPPPQFADVNVPPQPIVTDIPMAAEGTAPAAAGSEDGQVLVNLAAGAVARRGPDTSVSLTVTPLDPATLGPLPAGLRPDGNAYRVELHYRPSGEAITALATPGTIFLTVPVPTRTMYSAPDGHAWQPLALEPAQDPTVVGGPFRQTGYYLAAHAGTAVAGPDKKGGGTLTAVIVASAGAALLLLALALTPFVVRRRRRG